MSWLHTDYSKPLQAPVVSYPGGRTPWFLISVLWQFSITTALRWKKRDVTGDGVPETFCNFFTVAFCTAMGVLLPQLRANELFDWFSSDEAKSAGWELATEHAAQAMANEGMVAIAVWKNPEGPGHIAPLVPALTEPGTWIANVGATNFERGLLAWGFGSRQPLFFVHP